MTSKRGRFQGPIEHRWARAVAAAMLIAIAGGCQEVDPLVGGSFLVLGETVRLEGQVDDTDTAVIEAPKDAAPARPSLPSAPRPVLGADKVPVDDSDQGRGAVPPVILVETQMLDRQMVDPELVGPELVRPELVGSDWIDSVVDDLKTDEDATIPANAAPGERLDALLAGARHEDAADLVLDHKTYFRQHWPAYKDKINRIAVALNDVREPILYEAVGSLAHFRWPAPQDTWPLMRRALQDAQTVLDAYLEHPFLRDPPYRSSFADDLSGRINRARARIARFAGERFILYDHAKGPSFFDVWPLELDAARFMADNFVHLEGALADKPRADLDRFLTHYPAGEVLTGAVLPRFSDLYLAALVAEQPSTKSHNRLEDHLRAWQAARDRGLTPTGFGGLRIAVAVQAGEPDGSPEEGFAKDGSSIPSLRIDRDVAETGDAEDADFVILLERGPSRVAQNVILSERVPSLYLGGPEAGAADGRPAAGYFEALSLADAAMSAAPPGAENAGGNPLQFLVSFFGGGDSEAAENVPGEDGPVEAEAVARPAMSALAVVADYRDYVYTREEIEANKVLTINATLIDRASGEETVSVFEVTFRRRFVLVTGVRANDPGRAAHLAGADDDQAIAAWEKRSVTLPVSLVLGYFRGA